MGNPVPYWQDDAVTLYHADALDLLRSLPDASIDAVVTDPPYGLADHAPATITQALRAWLSGDREHVPAGKGFMGRDWDRFVPPPAVWDECLRVMKPGGHLLAFAGARTQDLMAMSIRLAGFEIRDCIDWIYGCLTADVDVLTEHGWRRGIDIAAGERIAQWDPTTGGITVAEVQRTYRAPWSGDLVRLRNTDTDQMLTPNHRVWRRNSDHRSRGGIARHEWGPYTACEAADIPRRSPSKLPLAGEHDGPGVGGTDYAALLGWTWTEGGFDRGTSTGVRIYQSSTNQAKVDEIAALMDRLGPHKRYDYPRTYIRRNGARHEYTAVTWFFTGELAQRVRADLPGKRPTYELLWRMTLAEKRAFLDAALKGDGSQGQNGSWQFYQRDAEDREWFVTLLALVGWRGHDAARKAPRTGGSVSVSQRADTTLTPAALSDDREHYDGEVWCVQVPTGAFLARRNGKVFITGNSGFPKSLDVSKAVDRHRAARGSGPVDVVRAWLNERRLEAGLSLTEINEALGVASNGGGLASSWMTNPTSKALPNWNQWCELKTLLGFGDDMDAEVRRLHIVAAGDDRPVVGYGFRIRRESDVQFTGLSDGAYEVTGAATETAAAWRGWGTALKPAHEPIVVARKALAGTVAANVLAHGTGALNVDACRTTAGQNYRDKCASVVGLASNRNGDAYGEWTGVREDSAHPAGRWPTNVVLSHAATSDGVDLCAGGCVDGCPVAELDRQSGVTVSSDRPRRNAALVGSVYGAQTERVTTGLADSGGASRFFPVFRYEAKAPTAERPRDGQTAHPTVKPLDLMRWLVRLVTPPNGKVLDPFAGSGTTGEACVIEGFECVLVEREAAYLPLITARLTKPLQPALDIFGGAA